MKPVRREIWLALAFILARALLCFWRAAHQSIVLDEAYTFNRYLQSWHDVYWLYETNNHVLFSILAKLSIRLFGLSELSLRLPTVIASFFLVFGVFRILENTVSRTIRWIALIAISLHPLLLDFSVAARGYGLSITLLIWAIVFAMRAEMRKSYAICGVLAALAISANLTALPAAFGLVVAILITENGAVKERLIQLAIFAAPFQIVAIALNFGALRTATLDTFSSGVGHTRWIEFIHDMVYNSIHTAHRDGPFGGSRAESLIVYVILPAIAILCLVTFARTRDQSKSALIPVITLTVALLVLIAMHYLLGVNYPEDRLGLYLVVLFALTWTIAAGRANIRWLQLAQVALITLLVTQFITQFNPYAFTIWKYDRETKAVALKLRDLLKDKPGGSVSVSTTWLHQPAMEFYRVALPIRALRPIDWPKQTQFSGFDYYVLNAPDTYFMSGEGIHVLFEDKRSGIALGAR
jgi:hypothetical protein